MHGQSVSSSVRKTKLLQRLRVQILSYFATLMLAVFPLVCRPAAATYSFLGCPDDCTCEHNAAGQVNVICTSHDTLVDAPKMAEEDARKVVTL